MTINGFRPLESRCATTATPVHDRRPCPAIVDRPLQLKFHGVRIYVGDLFFASTGAR
jgi:hypothetical protein